MKKTEQNNKKVSNGGYTIMELIIVIAILMAVAGIGITSIASMYKARSGDASTKVEALISRSKVNTLSGRRNKCIIRYDTHKQVYFVELYDVKTMTKNDSDEYEYTYEPEPYESQQIGNKRLNMELKTSAGNFDIKTNDFTLIFKTGTGKVAEAYVGDEEHKVSVIDESVVKLDVTHGATYNIVVYEKTGVIDRTLQA